MAKEVADGALRLSTGAEVRKFLKRELKTLLKELLEK